MKGTIEGDAHCNQPLLSFATAIGLLEGFPETTFIV
jgi:hypothetical protein